MTSAIRSRRSFVAAAGDDEYLVVFPRGDYADAALRLQQMAGVILVPALSDATLAVLRSEDPAGVVLPTLGAAVVRLSSAAYDAIRAATGPERSFATAEPIGSFSIFPTIAGLRASSTPRWNDDEHSTWGLHAIRAGNETGKGIRVAILDTGFGPCAAFDGRSVARNFDPRSNDTDDHNGHGTMCAGIACGGATASGQRYGVAPQAALFIAKVLGASGFGTPKAVVAGLEWAVQERCHVISMSFGLASSSPPIQGLSELASRAIEQGSLLVAASGDVGPGTPVLQPASAQNVLAVAAIDAAAAPYPGNCPAGPAAGEEVDLSGPGVAVRSVLPDSGGREQYASESGTSMAAPFVAGVAALWCERGFDARAVWERLISGVHPLGSTMTCGRGLVQAP